MLPIGFAATRRCSAIKQQQMSRETQRGVEMGLVMDFASV